MFTIHFPNKKEIRGRNLGTVLQQLLGIKNYAEETHANEKKEHKRLLNRVLCHVVPFEKKPLTKSAVKT
jgi:hypothetical protein